MEIKNLQRVHNYSLYYTGYRQGVIDWMQTIQETEKWKDKKVYRKAIFDLLTENLRNCDEYHSNVMDCYFKDHVKDKNGKLVECKAYFKREED